MIKLDKQDFSRLLIVTAIIALALGVGLFAMRYYIDHLEGVVAEMEQTISEKEAEITELQVLAEEVKDAETFIRMVNPGISVSEAHTLAVRQVAKARKYNIPRELIAYRDWAEADLHWLTADRKGPCGEHSTAQVWRPTFYALRPTGDYNDMDQVYDAGTQYLADCYRTALRWMPNASEKEVVRLTLAFYNAGMRHKPQVALYRARAHVRRVDGILAKAERLGVAV